jgi:two-component system chemotaxis sensor kinase CheA
MPLWIEALAISTAARVTSISGRGVGLDAVRSCVREKGGEVRIQLTGQGQDGCRPFELVIELPAAAVVFYAQREKRTSVIAA